MFQSVYSVDQDIDESCSIHHVKSGVLKFKILQIA